MIVTFDFETTNLDYGSALNPDNRILMVSWCVDDGPVKNFSGCIMDADEFWSDVGKADVLSAFHCKFEMHWFRRLGMAIDKWKWHDPMLAERVLQGNRHVPLNLGDTAARYGLDTKDPMIDSMMKAGVCPSDMPQKRLRARCNRDVRVTRELFAKQMLQLELDEQVHIYRTRVEFARVLTHMEANGMVLDKEKVLTAYSVAAFATAGLKAELDHITGGINLRSPDQLAKYLYETLKFPEKKGANKKPLRNKPSKQFPAGRPKTDKNTMAWLAKAATTDEQRKFIELRQAYGKANAALTKNLEFFKGVVDEQGGTFYAQFNQTVAATHRLSSSGIPQQFRQFAKPKSVQLQNMPREFKKLFRAPDYGDGEEWQIVEIDAAQLEFRVAAFCGQDKQAMEDIADPDFDAHCKSAAIMNGVAYRTFLDSYREGDPTAKRLRQEAKADTFKPLYGGTRGTPEQERYYKAFNARYVDLYNQQESWVAEVAATGQLNLPWGMKFYWQASYNRQGVLMDNLTKRPIGPQVFNYPVQSLATAEMMPIAITKLYDMCVDSGLKIKFVNTIHDSVICYVRKAELEQFASACRVAFTVAVRDHLQMFYGIDFNVPLGCGFTPGDHWGVGEEITYDEVEGSNNG